MLLRPSSPAVVSLFWKCQASPEPVCDSLARPLRCSDFRRVTGARSHIPGDVTDLRLPGCRMLESYRWQPMLHTSIINTPRQVCPLLVFHSQSHFLAIQCLSLPLLCHPQGNQKQPDYMKRPLLETCALPCEPEVSSEHLPRSYHY